MTSDVNLEQLQAQLDDQMANRGERFIQIGESDPDDPDHIRLLNDASNPVPTSDPTLALVQRLMGSVSRSTVSNARMMAEVGRCLGFDLAAINALTQVVADQQRQIEELRARLDA